jgi:hypothetical protein
MATTVTNSSATSNPDYDAKTTSTVDGLVQHVNVDNIAGISLPEYDYFAVTYPLTTQEVYVFKTGGAGGTTVATVTLNYTDATKEFLLNGAKT